MSNRYLVEGDDRARAVRELFGSIATRYDLLNDLQSFGLHRLWKRRVVRWAGVKRGERALDLCCGTGDIALALGAAGAEAVGVDFSPPMLEIARRRAAAWASSHSGVQPPQFENGDALSLRFADRTFDLVTIGYGLRNLQSLDAGLAEMYRVTAPAGRVVILDFAAPSNPIWAGIYRLYLRGVVPVLGRVFCGNRESYAYILESLNRYPYPAEIERRMGTAGWVDVEWRGILGGVMTIHRGRRGS